MIEPTFAGTCESYINMGAFYDLAALAECREAIMALTREYQGHYARAFRLLQGVSALSPLGSAPEEAILAAARRAKGIIGRELKPAAKTGRTVRRFLSAYTCKGPMTLWDTVPALARRVYVLDNDLGLAPIVIEALASAAEERGWDAIRCQSPLTPEVTEHLILPELSLAFVSQTSKDPYPHGSYRHLRLDALPTREEQAELRGKLKRLVKLRDAVLEEVTDALAAAKTSHDKLEEQYIPTVDFSGADRLAQHTIGLLLGK